METPDAKVCPLLPDNGGLQWGYLESGLSVLTVWGQPACNTEDPGLIPGLGISAGEEKKLPTLIFRPGELAHGVAKSQTGLNDFHFRYLIDSGIQVSGEVRVGDCEGWLDGLGRWMKS